MARTTLTAPAHVILQRMPGQFGAGSSVSPDAATSLCYGGGGFLDPRMAANKYNALGNGAMAAVVGWISDGVVCTLDYTPPAASTTNIAAAANVTSGTAMTLVSSSGAGVTVTSSAQTTMPFGTVIPAGTLAMGTAMGYLSVGIRDITAFYDPTKAWSCVIQITGSASSTGGNFLIKGWDIYGQPMSEVIAGPAGATSQNGKKAWKYIASVTPQFTDAHNYSVGTTLVTGLNMAADAAGYVDIWANGSGYTTNPSITAADTTNPATTTTGDVRGTTTLTAVRSLLFIEPSAARLTTSPIAQGMFGITNV
jgi:hypothetical protein